MFACNLTTAYWAQVYAIFFTFVPLGLEDGCTVGAAANMATRQEEGILGVD